MLAAAQLFGPPGRLPRPQPLESREHDRFSSGDFASVWQRMSREIRGPLLQLIISPTPDIGAPRSEQTADRLVRTAHMWAVTVMDDVSPI
jgi:hypothetical protein